MIALVYAQEVLYWVAFATLLLASALLWVSSVGAARGRRVMLAGATLLLAAAVVRWIVTGHPPIFGTFENSIASAWCIAMLIVFGRRTALLRDVPQDFERWFSLWLPVTLVFGATFTRVPYPLTISERSLVVDVHVIFAWAAYTVLLAAATAAVLVVAKRPGWEADAPERLMARGTGLGFALFTAMLALGSLYSYLLFADWFKWEMVEAFALATWLGYSSVLHVHMFFRWRGTKLAWAMLGVLPLLIGTFWVWSIYSGTYHHFEIPEIKA